VARWLARRAAQQPLPEIPGADRGGTGRARDGKTA